MFLLRLQQTEKFEVFLPLPLGEGWGEGLCASSFAPSPNPSQREGNKDIYFSRLCTLRSASFTNSSGIHLATPFTVAPATPFKRSCHLSRVPSGTRWRS